MGKDTLSIQKKIRTGMAILLQTKQTLRQKNVTRDKEWHF